MLVKQRFIHLGDLKLASGEMINELILSYEVYGQLNATKSNAILLSHTLTSNQHAAGFYQPDDKNLGWWHQAIGPDKDINTDEYCIICINNLAGSHGSSSPMSINPKTNKPYALDFPVVNIVDMVNAEKKLMDYLNIPKWHCLIGGCMGGFKTLQWLTSYPQACNHAIIIATNEKASAHTIASWYIMRQCIISDPAWNNGNYYYQPPSKGIGFANMVGTMIWLSRDYLESKFTNKRHHLSNQLLSPEYEVEYYLDAIQHKQSSTIDPNSLLYMMKAMTSFDLNDDQNWPKSLKNISGNVLFISYQHDWRYPPDEVEKLKGIFRSQHINADHQIIDSKLGHGAFIYDYASLSPKIAKWFSTILPE